MSLFLLASKQDSLVCSEQFSSDAVASPHSHEKPLQRLLRYTNARTNTKITNEEAEYPKDGELNEKKMSYRRDS